ncbi:unnamed protein product [Tilletia controversa]|nr:hypothetical protein CF328_g7162 [Tilletia controversa]CAD6943112.1 unnamed protein product [Tilletia controversa]
MDYPPYNQQQQQGQPQMEQYYQRHHGHEQGSSSNGFYTQPLAYRSSGYLAQPDGSSVKSTSDFYSPSGSPRPSVNQSRENQNDPYASTHAGAHSSYGALQHDLEGARGGGGGEASTIGGGDGAGRSSTASLISDRNGGSSAYRGPQPAQGSALRNAFPMTAEDAQPNVASGRIEAPVAVPYRPVLKGGISEKKSFQQRNPWFIRFSIIFMLCAIAGGVFALVKILQRQSDKSGGWVPGPGGSSVSTYFKLPAWNWTDPTSKAFGVNLGNFLVLERWLDEDTFISMCGADAFDEYHCTKTLGATASVTALQNHYNTFLAETDINAMQAVGVNLVRITLGYWALIPLQNEPYVDAGQMDQLKKVLGWLNTRKMRAVISLHGLPGSQSGDQSTGQFRKKDRGSNWFTAENQQRSIATIQALVDWKNALGPELSSTISAILPVNEPDQRHGDDGTFAQTLQDFYTQSYAILSQNNVVMAIHSGQGNSSYPQAWYNWLADKDPSTILWEAHPYPGWFPSQSSKHHIYKKICEVVNLSTKLPPNVPVFVGEFSVLSGVQEDGWVDTYWQTQLAAYSQSAGSAFWTWNAKSSSNPVVALNSTEMANYNFQGLVDQSIIHTPPRGRTISGYLSTLENNACQLAASTAADAGSGSADGSGSGSGSDVDDDAGNPKTAQDRRRRGETRLDFVSSGSLRRRS